MRNDVCVPTPAIVSASVEKKARQKIMEAVLPLTVTPVPFSAAPAMHTASSKQFLGHHRITER